MYNVSLWLLHNHNKKTDKVKLDNAVFSLNFESTKPTFYCLNQISSVYNHNITLLIVYLRKKNRH